MTLLDKMLFYIQNNKKLNKYFWKYKAYKLFNFKYNVQFTAPTFSVYTGYTYTTLYNGIGQQDLQLYDYVFTSLKSAKEIYRKLEKHFKKDKDGYEIALWNYNINSGCEKSIYHK